jgi:predicted nucleotidyltransferase component of viral defense system
MTISQDLNRTPAAKRILTSAQEQFLESFFAVPDANLFFLTGGTALAGFYLGHRKSFDMDFFTNKDDLIQPFSTSLERTLPRKFNISFSRRFQSFSEFFCQVEDEELRVQLAYDSPFRLQAPVKTGNIMLNDYQDLAVDKLLAFFGRTAQKDTIDVFFILQKENISFWTIEPLAREKNPGFDLYWMAQACQKVLEFPDHISSWQVQMVKPVEAEEVKSFFKSLREELMIKINT